MSLLETLIPELQPWAQRLYDLARQAGVRPQITSALRTYAQQETAYKAYVGGRSRYPAAPPGTSAHEYGYAFDLVVDNDIDQNDLGTVWKRWNGVWGGDFRVKDPIHFEFPGFTTAGRVPLALQAPNQSDTRRIAEQLADLLLQLVPTPLRGILNISGLANQIWTIAGGDQNVLLYWLSHPAEFVDAFEEILWGLVRAVL